MLTGNELLAKVAELKGARKDDLVRACGYVTSMKDGKERVNRTAFYQALLDAKGVALDDGPSGPGRQVSFVTRVHFNGNLLIGKAYTRMMELEPGDEFQIVLSARTGQIRLIPVGSELDGGDAGDVTSVESPALASASSSAATAEAAACVAVAA